MKKLVMFFSGALIFAMLSAPLHAEPRTAFVHLFEWQWNDVAYECEAVLGPKGYSAVQVSPPQKSVGGSQWWTRYQPVSYAIEGRSGSRSEFISMINRCKAVGVDIYVDAVINHMAAWDRNFPEVPYSTWDFHNCTKDIDYSNRWEIQNCDLVSLNDLATEKEYVRNKIADYLNELTSLGVAGFRIDAAKHIPANDLAAIKSKLNGNPYIYQEVIGAPGEPVQPSEYSFIGDVTEFNFTNTLGYYFKLRGPLKNISNIGTWGGWLSSDDAVTFVANHDNQRQQTAKTITHKDGNNANNLAHAFLLGWPYGYPKVMSSYDWNDHDQGPPSHGAASCNGGWLCEHRDRAIANMVGFRNATADKFFVSDYWDNGNNQMAWGRGGAGFVAINMEGYNLDKDLNTGMPAGVYCDIINGDFDAATKSCSGETISVNDNGTAHFKVYPRNGAAIHINAVVQCTNPADCGPKPCEATNSCPSGNVEVTFTCENGYTQWGQSVYVIGNQTELGSWNPANAIKLDASAYPSWSKAISVPANTNVEWKCLKRNETNPADGRVWQNGVNNQFNVSETSSQTASF
jgi:alpha-amylase